MTWDDIKAKLTSRKMWLALCEFVSMLLIACGESQDTATRICALIMAGAGVIAYVIGEGLVDAASAKSDSTPILLSDISDGVDPETKAEE